MSTIGNIGGVPIIAPGFAQTGYVLSYNDGSQGPPFLPFWEAVPLSVPSTQRRQGAFILEPNITTVGSEVLLARMVIDPTAAGINTGAFTFGLSFRFLGVLTDGGGTPSFVVRMYDLGAVNSPIAPVLRATSSALGSPNYGSVRQVQKAVSAVSTISFADEILDSERVYEFTGEITGSVGDVMDLNWLGFVYTS